MAHTPPAFFNRGPAPVVRLAFFAALSLAILVLDTRFRYAEGLRSIFAAVAYPLQQVASLPIQFTEKVATFFTSQRTLREENADLRTRLLAASSDAQRHAAAESELSQLRRLIGAAPRSERPPVPAEILYAARDPYSYKVFIDRGTNHGVRGGSPVIDETGAIGQVTRAQALISEVTLLIDKDMVIPVQVLRNGLRAVAFGGGKSGMLELRYMAANADVQNGDRLVTSGIDGTYPPGLPVATVILVERDSAQAFARIVCEPAAGVARGRYVLVLERHEKAVPPPRDSGERRPGFGERLRPSSRKATDAGR